MPNLVLYMYVIQDVLLSGLLFYCHVFGMQVNSDDVFVNKYVILLRNSLK